MKLNKTQTETLAREVLNKIPIKEVDLTKKQLDNISKLSNEMKITIIEQEKLNSKISKIRESLSEMRIFQSIPPNLDISNLDKLKTRLLKAKRPVISEIIDKITLETIFETKTSLNDFINNLVKQYS